MIVTAWNNGKHNPSGSGYGLSVTKKDRILFQRNWGNVIIELDQYNTVVANIDKNSFWNSCPHFISKDIGVWLINLGLASWTKNKPPRFKLIQIEKNQFKIESQIN